MLPHDSEKVQKGYVKWSFTNKYGTYAPLNLFSVQEDTGKHTRVLIYVCVCIGYVILCLLETECSMHVKSMEFASLPSCRPP